MKGFNGSKPISDETRHKMSESAKKTLNGFRSGHPKYLEHHSEESKAKMRVKALADGRRPDFTGRKHSEESKEKMRQSTLANPCRYWLGKDRSAIFTKEYRQKMSEAMKKLVAEGRNNFYIDGRTPINQKIRHSLEYQLWREEVFKRDNWTCILCGAKFIKGVTGDVILNADHIKRFADNPELRFELSNGRTLCHSCHLKTDTFGRRGLSPAGGATATPSLGGMVQ